MTYKINKTDGTLLAEIVDSSVDQVTTDLTLIGKNVAGYGEFFNENLVKLLENFANTSEPNNPITGQIWFDTATNRLKVYDGNGFRIGSGPIVQGTAPTNVVQGDMWINSLENRLYFYTTANNRFEASKIWNDSQGKSGLEVVSLYDTNNSLQHVVYLWVSNMLLGIFSKSTTAFTPKTAIPGFTDTIKPGFTAGTLSGIKFNVRASSADFLANSQNELLNADAFMSRVDDNSSAGTLTIQNALPLILGPNQNFEVAANSTALTITSNNSGQDYKIRVKNSGGTKDAITVKSLTQRVGIFNESPSYTLDVAGTTRTTNLVVLGNLITPWQTYDCQIVSSGNFVTGNTYTILNVGDTNFVLLGAAANTVGTVFIASGPGTLSETGTATVTRAIAPGDQTIIDTTLGPITIVLPGAPTIGDFIRIIDGSASGFSVNPLTINRNTNKINGLSTDLLVDTDGSAFTLVYTGASRGWAYANANTAI